MGKALGAGSYPTEVGRGPDVVRTAYRDVPLGMTDERCSITVLRGHQGLLWYIS